MSLHHSRYFSTQVKESLQNAYNDVCKKYNLVKWSQLVKMMSRYVGVYRKWVGFEDKVLEEFPHNEDVRA